MHVNRIMISIIVREFIMLQTHHMLLVRLIRDRNTGISTLGYLFKFKVKKKKEKKKEQRTLEIRLNIEESAKRFQGSLNLSSDLSEDERNVPSL